MPTGPKGQKRPADVIGCAITVARIATGEVVEGTTARSGRTRSGKAGGAARAEKLSKARRIDIAKKAAKARWGS